MVGHLLFLRMVVRVTSFFLLGTVSFWHYRGRYQLAASVLLIAAMLVISRLRTLAPFAVLIPVVALGNSFVYAGSLFHGVAGSSNRAARMAIQEALMSGGYILGASVGGLLYQHASFQAALLFCALCLLAALAAQIAILAVTQTGFGRRVRRKSLL
jgi:predicted MFS family arabinose efflux permease